MVLLNRFSYEENGYNRKEVNKFIDEVISNTEDIINSCKNQREEIRRLQEEIEKYKNNNTNNVTYKYDLETANSIRKSALEDAKDIINTAKSNASIIVNDALIKASELELKSKKLERNIKVFKTKLDVLMKQQQAIVDEIENIEIEND